MTFDQALVAGILDRFNWTFRADLGLGPRVLTFSPDPVASGSTVSGPVIGFVGAPPPDEVDYSAATPDVVGLLNGLPAAAFVNFPVAVIP